MAGQGSVQKSRLRHHSRASGRCSLAFTPLNRVASVMPAYNSCFRVARYPGVTGSRNRGSLPLCRISMSRSFESTSVFLLLVVLRTLCELRWFGSSVPVEVQ
jgi:hypothetical protein